MNRRLAIIIGAGLVVIGLAALSYFGYILFGGRSGDAATTSPFFLEQDSDINPEEADQHVVVVYGKFTPPEDTPSDWACVVRAWDWGDGSVSREDNCTPWINQDTVVFTGDHKYADQGKYAVKLYVTKDQNFYESDELKVSAP